MSSDLNQLLLIGRLGGQPECRSTGSGALVCTASLATNRRTRDVDGWTEKTDWHKLVAFGRVAEELALLATGTTVGVEGSLTYSTWQTRAGESRTTAEVSVRRIFYTRAKGQRDPPVPECPEREEEHEWEG